MRGPKYVFHAFKCSLLIPRIGRLLASDMRAVLCSAFMDTIKFHNDTSACDSLLNMPQWSKEGFINSYTDATFAQLLSPALRNNPNFTLTPSLQQLHLHMMGLAKLTDSFSSGIMQKPNEDALLWDGPDAPAWVACNQRNKTCYGKIAKSVWYDRTKRAGACLDAFLEQVRSGKVNSSAVGIDICNLNGKTNALCQIIKAAQGKVFEANCIFAGVCAPQAFVYTPGMYSSSNQDFVRGTVSSFYEMFKQVAARRSDADSNEDDEFRAFAFTNNTADDEMVSCSYTVLFWPMQHKNIICFYIFYPGLSHGQHGVGAQGQEPGHEKGVRIRVPGQLQAVAHDGASGC